MSQNQPETHSLDLTNFAKSIFEGNDEYNLLKNPNDEKHFEPIPNGFYGFAIPIPDIFAPANVYCGHKNHLWVNPMDEPNNIYCSFCKMPYSIFEAGTFDIDYEDITQLATQLRLKEFDPGIAVINPDRIKFEDITNQNLISNG